MLNLRTKYKMYTVIDIHESQKICYQSSQTSLTHWVDQSIGLVLTCVLKQQSHLNCRDFSNAAQSNNNRIREATNNAGRWMLNKTYHSFWARITLAQPSMFSREAKDDTSLAWIATTQLQEWNSTSWAISLRAKFSMHEGVECFFDSFPWAILDSNQRHFLWSKSPHLRYSNQLKENLEYYGELLEGAIEQLKKAQVRLRQVEIEADEFLVNGYAKIEREKWNLIFNLFD